MDTSLLRRVKFDYDRDVPRLQRFLASLRQRFGQSGFFHLGDLLWRIHHPPNAFNATTDLPIWETPTGKVAGFGFYLRSQDNPEFFMDPTRYRGDLADAMVDWAVAVATEQGRERMETSCVAADSAKAAFLERHGFRCIDEPMVFMARQLDAPIVDAHVPSAYTIEPLRWRGPDVSVTGSRPITRDAYAAMRASVGYRPDLDVKAYRGDAIVAGCLCWLDEIDGCGELEPVGTHPDHRRKGLASGCIARALQALRGYGATTAYVRADQANTAAVALYESLGFRTIDIDLGWERQIAPQSPGTTAR